MLDGKVTFEGFYGRLAKDEIARLRRLLYLQYKDWGNDGIRDWNNDADKIIKESDVEVIRYAICMVITDLEGKGYRTEM